MPVLSHGSNRRVNVEDVVGSSNVPWPGGDTGKQSAHSDSIVLYKKRVWDTFNGESQVGSVENRRLSPECRSFDELDDVALLPIQDGLGKLVHLTNVGNNRRTENVPEVCCRRKIVPASADSVKNSLWFTKWGIPSVHVAERANVEAKVQSEKRNFKFPPTIDIPDKPNIVTVMGARGQPFTVKTRKTKRDHLTLTFVNPKVGGSPNFGETSVNSLGGIL